MIEIDLNEQFIIYVVYKGCGKWYISDKEIWYLDYQKRIEAYRKRGYEIKEEYIDEERRDLLYVDEKNALLFLKRIEEDECSTGDLKELFYKIRKRMIICQVCMLILIKSYFILCIWNLRHMNIMYQ